MAQARTSRLPTPRSEIGLVPPVEFMANHWANWHASYHTRSNYPRLDRGWFQVVEPSRHPRWIHNVRSALDCYPKGAAALESKRFDTRVDLGAVDAQWALLSRDLWWQAAGELGSEEPSGGPAT